MPQNCPMRAAVQPNALLPEYLLPENRMASVQSAEVEAAGYGEWPRVREVAEFCKRMGYRRIGIAFCTALQKEAMIASQILAKHGLMIDSVICKCGHVDKAQLGIVGRVRPDDGFEAMCNPILQAKLLNDQKTEFNVIVGLCVGHDSLFTKYSDALVTTLVAKDRVLAHNPAGALYCADGPIRKRLYSEW